MLESLEMMQIAQMSERDYKILKAMVSNLKTFVEEAHKQSSGTNYPKFRIMFHVEHIGPSDEQVIVTKSDISKALARSFARDPLNFEKSLPQVAEELFKLGKPVNELPKPRVVSNGEIPHFDNMGQDI